MTSIITVAALSIGISSVFADHTDPFTGTDDHCIITNDANLSGNDYSNCSLPFVNLENRNLDNTIVTFADLSNAILSGGSSIGADFTGSNLTDTRFIARDITDADFIGANMFKANLARAFGSGADFTGAFVLKMNLDGANLANIELSGTDLTGADLTALTLVDSYLIGTDLAGVNISNSKFTGTDMSNANLAGTDLRGSDFTNAILSNTNLQNADFTDTVLVNTNFTGCFGTPLGVPKVGTLPTCDGTPINPPLDPVFDEDFETFSGWTTIGSGSVNSVTASDDTVSGSEVALKTGNGDPNGAYKNLDATVDDFEMVVYAKKLNENGGPAMRYSITQDFDGNGYGFYISPTHLTIEKRGTSLVASPVASALVSGWDLEQWNTLRFTKIGNELQVDFYKNQIVPVNAIDSIAPSVSLSVTNSEYSGGFNFAAINGGADYETDDYKIWSIASIP